MGCPEKTQCKCRDACRTIGGMEGLLAAPLERLLDARGVGLAKASQIKAIQVLGTRLTEAELVKAQRFQDPTAVSQYYLRKPLGHLPREAFDWLFFECQILTAEL